MNEVLDRIQSLRRRIDAFNEKLNTTNANDTFNRLIAEHDYTDILSDANFLRYADLDNLPPPVRGWLERTLQAMKDFDAIVRDHGIDGVMRGVPIGPAWQKNVVALQYHIIHMPDFPAATAEPLPVAATQGKGRPVAALDTPLDEREELILVEMFTAGATTEKARLTQAEIVAKCQKNATPESWKRYFAKLSKLDYLASKIGPSGGCWLTSKGKQKAIELNS